MAEGARLESVFRVKPNEGSNPSLSAIFMINPLILLAGFLFYPQIYPLLTLPALSDTY